MLGAYISNRGGKSPIIFIALPVPQKSKKCNFYFIISSKRHRLGKMALFWDLPPNDQKPMAMYGVGWGYSSPLIFSAPSHGPLTPFPHGNKILRQGKKYHSFWA